MSLPTPPSAAVPITSSATVSKSTISIEIHGDIYNHIETYLGAGDYFHAVEESYKLVREKLRDLTGYERATDVFNPAAHNKGHYQSLFGKPDGTNQAERDFFQAVGYLHLCVQYLRNEKAHTPATPLEPNLALHYISLASLAYDLITRYISDETITQIEEAIRSKRSGYSTVAFYRAFEDGSWIKDMDASALNHTAVRRILKEKWIGDADFTVSYDHSNIGLMRLQLVEDVLTSDDIDHLLDKPVMGAYGNSQLAGMSGFLRFVETRSPGKLSAKAKDWLSKNEA